MSAIQTRTAFSRKTVAIAVASAVAIGSVQITAPANGVFAAATAQAETVNVGDNRSATANLFDDGLYYLGAAKRNNSVDRPTQIVFTSSADRDNLQAAFFLNDFIIRDAGFDPTKPVTLSFGNSNGTSSAENIRDGIELYKGKHGPGMQGMTKLDISPAENNKAASAELRFDEHHEYAVYIKDTFSNLMNSYPISIKQDGHTVSIDSRNVRVNATPSYGQNQRFIPGETYELATLEVSGNVNSLIDLGHLKPSASAATGASPGVWAEKDGIDKLKVMYRVPMGIETTQQRSLQLSWNFTGPRRAGKMNTKRDDVANFTFDVIVGSDALDNQPVYPVATVKPGEASTVDPTSFAYKAEYEIDDTKMTLPSGWSAPTIDAKTGAITVNAPKSAKTGDVIDIPLTVTYRDGTVDNETIRFTVNEKETFVSNIVKNDDGTYTLIRNNGDEVEGTIDTSGSVTDIKPDGKGNLIVTIDGKDKEVPLDQVEITETNKGKPNHTITITTPNGDKVTFNAFDTYVTDITKNADGDYDIYRSDKNGGTTVWKTIKLDDLRKAIADLKDKDAEHDERLDDLDKQLDDANDELDDLAEKVANNEGAIEDHRKSIGDILVNIGNIESDIEDIEDELVRLDGQDIKEVRDNGDGTYTLIRNNDDEVNVDIGSSETVTDITPNKDGSITVHKIDGSKVKVDLAKVKITEKNKGTPDHTITIKVPGEKPFTFNAYDNYIVDVKREDNGNYTVVRRDGESWEINLKDIRDRITALEDKDSPTRDEFDAVKKDLADLTTRVNKEFKKIDNRFENVEGDIENLRNDLTVLENRVTKVEARLTDVEDHADAITKCLYGTGMAAIPAALSIPLALMTQVQIPGVAQLNTDIQRQIGIYDENLAKMWGEYGGVLQAGAALSALAGIIGGLAYITNECAPLTETDAAQETDLGQLSSKLEQGSSRKNDAAAPETDAPKDETEAEADAEAESEKDDAAA